MPPRNVYRPPGARKNQSEPHNGTNRPFPSTAGDGRNTRTDIPGADASSRLKPAPSTPGLSKDRAINFEYILTPSRSSGLDKGGDV